MFKRARSESPEAETLETLEIERSESPEVVQSSLLWEELIDLDNTLLAIEEEESISMIKKRTHIYELVESIKLVIYQNPEDHQLISMKHQMDAIDYASKLLRNTIKFRNSITLNPRPSDSALEILKKSQRNRQQNGESIIETAMDYLEENVLRFSNRVHNSLDLCVICHGDFKSGQSVSRFPCYENHEFHTSCVKILLRTSFRCPICSSSIDEIAATRAMITE